MRNSKRLMFFCGGLLGGIVGALFAELSPDFGRDFLTLSAAVSLWSGMAAAFITIGLFAAGENYNRKPFSAPIYMRAFSVGMIAGGLAGFVAQSVFNFTDQTSFFGGVIVRSLCWGVMGTILGWRLSIVIPNLGWSRGMASGALGGVVGGVAFLLLCTLLPELLGRAIGLGLLGAALGLAVVTVEETFRAASLEIIWAPKEVTSVTLGETPIYLGGGDDHVFVAGLPQHALSVQLKSGQIHCSNHTNGTNNVLKEGSRIKIGKIEIVVRTKTAISK
jgi:hypothetical protein